MLSLKGVHDAGLDFLENARLNGLALCKHLDFGFSSLLVRDVTALEDVCICGVYLHLLKLDDIVNSLQQFSMLFAQSSFCNKFLNVNFGVSHDISWFVSKFAVNPVKHRRSNSVVRCLGPSVITPWLILVLVQLPHTTNCVR